MSTKWDNCHDVEAILDNLRINSVNLADYHRKRFYHFKSFGKYFRIPIIVLSSITASASVGLQPVLDQGVISGLTCLLGFGIAVISSIEMYLGIQTAMDQELALSRDYYTLAIDIYKCLNLAREHRSEEPQPYLDKKYGDYKALREASSLLKHRMNVDLLAIIPDGLENNSETSFRKYKIPIMESLSTAMQTDPPNSMPSVQSVTSLPDEIMFGEL